MKKARKTPDSKVLASILVLARKGQTRERLAEAASLPDTQFRRHMAALVDGGLIRYDLSKKLWVTTDRGYRYLKS
ncbi:MAG: hypothetical protein QXJ74_03850 [Nitrososphaera sp.]|uniref:hypothetical protein n=1 Tax=Nitrososphaera sp. TaxID=1971748 RepID=UPI0018017F65|nr:hypothetical protein [Nitrososphaera sp.]NWG37736.1 hypothetical protein [Nitrososphaera sp.]